jgi:hypothetical protein
MGDRGVLFTELIMDCDSPAFTSQVAGITGMNHQTSLKFIDLYSSNHFSVLYFTV